MTPITVGGYRPVKELPLTYTKDAEGNAGYDLVSTESATLAPGEIRRVKLNAHFAIPTGYYGRLTPRSGLSSQGINVIPGVIDSTYRGQLQAIVKNELQTPVLVEEGMRLAQILFLKHETPSFVEVEDLENLGKTDRGEDGFGSSGKF